MDKLNVRCAHCGSDLTESSDDPRDEDTITCAGCGAIGKRGEIKAAALKQAMELATKVARDAFRKFTK